MTALLSHPPVVVVRAAQPYVGVRRLVTMQTMREVADRIPEVLAWVADRGLTPAGPPFLRYHVVDMEHGLEVEAGVPLDDAVPGAGEVRSDVLPAGRYVTLDQVGHPDGLVAVITELLAWARRQGLAWDREPTPAGERWGCRVESYRTDPAEEPDRSRWTVELAFRLAD
jgi:hypothetical protein